MNNRKVNCISIFWVLMMVVLSLTACSDDDNKADFYLEASTDLINLDYQGHWDGTNDNASFELGANVSWKVTSVNEWINLSHTEGVKGRTTLFLSVDENLTGEDREGLIIIEGNGLYQYIDVYQTLKTDELTVRPINLMVTKSGRLETGEQASIDIETNSKWEIVECADWIKPEKTQGNSGYSAVALVIDQNMTGDVRTGSLVVHSGSKDMEVTITQNLEGLKVTPRSIEVNIEGKVEGKDEVTLQIESAENWILDNGTATWITPELKSGNAGTVSLNLSIDKNETGTVRTGKLNICTTSGLEEVVTIVQTLRRPAAVLYYEPFDWCTNAINKPGAAAVQDPVGTNGKSGTTFNLFDKNYTGAKEAFIAAGLSLSFRN